MRSHVVTDMFHYFFSLSVGRLRLQQQSNFEIMFSHKEGKVVPFLY
jgi:hypothetical protein